MQVALGQAGENLVEMLLKEDGRRVVISPDPYDSQKDMIVDGNLSVEVKTQVPFIKENAITFRPNQLQKCISAHEVYFVLIDAPKHTYHYSGWVLKASEPSRLLWRNYTTKDGRDMTLIDIDQKALELWKRIPKNHLQMMNKLTISKY